MTAIAINGATGRMGRTIVSLLVDHPRMQLSRALTHQHSEFLGRDIGLLAGTSEVGVPVTAVSREVMQDVDVVIDFSTPTAIPGLLNYCIERNIGLVSGTTGFNDEQQRLMARAGEEVPVLFAPNMSVGVNVAFRLLEQATQMLGTSVDVEIYESHHRGKLDSPSGTAKRMGEIVASSRDHNLSPVQKTNQPATGRSNSIKIHSARGGDVVGEHTVTFFGVGERLEIIHRAASRINFASGAIQAAAFIAHKREEGAVGIYTMQEVLGLR